MRSKINIAIVVAAAFLAGITALPNAFVFDDRRAIVENQKVIAQDWGGIWKSPSWFQDKNDRGWRPLTSSSFAADWKIYGPKPAFFRAENLLLHAANSVLVLKLAMIAGASPYICFLSGLLFALHSIHTEVLNPIVGRADLLATFAVLLCCLLYARGKSFFTSIVFALGLLAKESAVTFLFLAPFLDIFFRAHREELRAKLGRYASLIVILIAYLLIRKAVAGELLPSSSETSFLDNPLTQADFFKRVSNALYVLWRYIFLMLAPYNLSADYSFNAIPVLNAFAPRNLAAITLLSLGGWGLWKWAKKKRIVVFSAVFFLVTFALVSNVPLLVGTIMAERLVYLPSAGFCILLALILNSPKSRKVVLALSLLVLSFYAWINIRRNADWKNDATIFLKTLKTSPASMKMMVNAGQSLLNLKRYEESRDLNLKAIKLSDKFPLPFSNLGVAYLKLGDMTSAEAAFQSALQRDPDYIDAWVNIGIIFAKQRRFDGAITAFEKALEYEPESPKLHNNLALAYKQKGVALHSMGDKKEALELFMKSKTHYERALSLSPEYEEAMRNFSGLTPWLENREQKP